MTDRSPPIPTGGGSFVVNAKGRLEQREKTLGPRDPAHETNRAELVPKQATAPAKER